jgi:putative tricarboxylic transport membrane protein
VRHWPRPPAKVALSFGPPEFFTIALLGLFTLSRISGGPLWQSMLVLSLGLGMATVGMDTISATVRFTYGSLQLSQGINIIPVVMGLFGIAEVLSVAERAGGLPQVLKVKFRELFPTRSEWRRALPAMFRGTGVGFFWGLIPGPSTVLSTFASYNLERRISKHKDEFGKGAIEGVAGPEAANNAAQAGTMVPLLSMGIPFTPGAAMLLAGLMMQGIRTGPLLIVERPEVFWGVVASMYLGNLALLVLNLPLVGMWVSVLRIPQSILLTLIMLLTLVGAYSVNNSALDLVVLVGTGIIGYVFRKLKLDIAPMVVALVIGPMLEESFRQSLFISRGDPLIFFQRPISGAILMILVLIMIAPVLWRGLRSRLEKLPSD